MNSLVLSSETAVAPSEVFFDGQSMTEIDVYAQCDEIIQDLYETNDPTRIQGAIVNLNGIEKFAAKAKAKLVYAWSEWYRDNQEGDFADWYVEKFGGEKLTVQKHQAIGELLTNEEVPEEVKQLPMGELVSVARAVAGGYNLADHWKEIQMAGSEVEINDIIRRVRGKEKRAGSLDIVISPDGTITAWENNEWVNVGWLNFADLNDEAYPEVKQKILKKATERVINNTGIRRK